MGKVALGSLAYGDGGSPESFTNVTGVMDIQAPGFEVTAIEFSSIEAARKTYEPGKPAIQAVSGNIEYDPDNAAHVQALTDLLARTKRNWRLTLTDTSPDTTVTFEAFVSTWGPPAVSDDEKLTLPFALQPTDNVTYS